MRDTVNLIRQGVPCVGLVHDHFEKLAYLQCRQLGMPDAPLLIYPQDLPSADSPESVQQKAQSVVQQSIDMLQSGFVRVAKGA